MARGRMVSSSIRNSSKMAALSCDGARLLFMHLILSADNLGRLRGEPGQVKWECLPRNKATERQIEAWLGEMAQLGLVCWYKTDEQRFLHIVGWDKHQKLNVNYSRSSHLPEPPVQCTEDARAMHVGPSVNAPHEVEVEVEVFSVSEPTASTENTCRWRDVFTLFWKSYPHFEGRSSKAKSLALWEKLQPQTHDHAEAIRAHLRACKNSHDWTKDGGSFVPAAQKWLGLRGWQK